jgi:hypothetical protein
MAYFGALLLETLQTPAPSYLFDTAAVRDARLDTRVSLLHLPLVRHHPWVAWAIAIAACAYLIAGRFLRPAALVLFAITLSTARSLYPLVGAIDQLAVHTALWCALLAGSAEPGTEVRSATPVSRCSALACLGSTLLFWTTIDRAESGLISAACAATLALMASIALAPRRARAVRVTGAMTLGVILCALLVSRWLASWAGATSTHLAIDRLLIDAGVECPAPSFRSTPDLHVRVTLPGGSELSSEDLRLLPRANRAWSYAAHAPAAPGDGVMDRLKSQGSVRMRLAIQACASLSLEGTVEVLAKGGTIFRFHCDAGQPRLVVPPTQAPLGRDLSRAEREPIKARKRHFEQRLETEVPTSEELSQYLLDSHRLASGPPIQELLRVARIRFAWGELDEARRLVEIAFQQATPAVRKRAGLQQLRDVVMAAGR